MVASADAVEIDGIYYNLVTKVKQAEVTSNPNKYTGIIVIPETVNYDNVTYDVTSIGAESFMNCSSLTSITIPNSITSIGGAAFEGCNSLTSITIGNSVKSIERYAFVNCRGLTSITIPNSVASIGMQAFYGCTGLTSIIIPNSVTSIEWGTFQNCSGLTSVTIGNSVTSIGANAFSGCTGLTSVTIPNSVINITGFDGCTGLTSVTIGNSVTSINNNAFQNCSGLTSITIPNSVTNIGNQVFSGCTGLTSITIGSGIESIGSQAFAKCSELTDVHCYAETVPSTNSDAFNEAYIEYATLHVPAASVNSYKATEPWKNFKSIVSIEGGDTPETQKCETPTISYKDGKLMFSCATDGVECVTNISDADIKTHYGNEITLTATYNISVYATKAGYDNSETVTATLCWIEQKPATEGITDGIANVPAKALLIKNNGGQITIEGAADGEAISVYTVNGVKNGSAISQNGAASIDTNLQAGSIAIVKIGDKSVKVVIK